MVHDGEWLKSVPIAHRGFHSKEFPENSIGAFINAKKYGFAIELDVQLSVDNNVIVFHDTDTFRMTQEWGKIEDLTLSQIKKRRLVNSDFEIPTLKEVFDIIGIDVPILIEIKNTGSPGELERLVCLEINKHQGVCAVQSFNPFSLQSVKKECPHILRGQLSCKDEKANVYGISEPDFIAYRIEDLPDENICSFRKKGIPIIGWTITTREQYCTAKKCCDNIIFENVEFIDDLFSFYRGNNITVCDGGNQVVGNS